MNSTLVTILEYPFMAHERKHRRINAAIVRERNIVRQAQAEGRGISEVEVEWDERERREREKKREERRRKYAWLRLLGKVAEILIGVVVWCAVLAAWVGGGGSLIGASIERYTWPVVKWFGVEQAKWGNMCWGVGTLIALLIFWLVAVVLNKMHQTYKAIAEAVKAWAVERGWMKAPPEDGDVAKEVEPKRA